MVVFVTKEREVSKMGGKWSQKESASNMLEQVTYEIADFPIHSRECVLEGKDRMVLPWHWHSQVEFLYVEKGEITCCVNTSSICLRSMKESLLTQRKAIVFCEMSGQD